MPYDKKNKLHIVAVAAVIRRADGRYLVLKRSEREVAFPGRYGFPGGKVEAIEPVIISEDFSEYKWVNREELQALDHIGIEEEIVRVDTVSSAGIDMQLVYTPSTRRDEG